jgi:energy-converting hydrogenase Eha subunit A
MLPKWVVRTIVAAVLAEIIRLIFQLLFTQEPPMRTSWKHWLWFAAAPLAPLY